MQTIWLIIYAVFCAIGGYCIGLRRGFKCYEHDYDEGYLAGYNDAVEEHKRGVKLNCLVNALDDLFKDDDDITDCGEY